MLPVDEVERHYLTGGKRVAEQLPDVSIVFLSFLPIVCENTTRKDL